MSLEFLAGSSEDEKASYDARHSFSMDCHVLSFRYSEGDASNVYGGLMLRPNFSIAYIFWGDNSKASSRLRNLWPKVGVNYGDLVARVMSDTPQELLERNDGFFSAVKRHFPGVDLTERNVDALRSCGRLVAAESLLVNRLVDIFPDVRLEGEPVVDFMLNEQGKKYGLSFYNKIKRGIVLGSQLFGFGDPSGTVKGILLHKEYSPYTWPEGQVHWYFRRDKAPQDLKACSPFST